MISRMEQRLAAQEEQMMVEIQAAVGYAERSYARICEEAERFTGHINRMRSAARNLAALRQRRRLVAIDGGRAESPAEPPRAA